MYLFYKVGSEMNIRDLQVLSFFEHMMFNGAKNMVQNSLTKLWSLMEVQNNAYTTENVTVYTNFSGLSCRSYI
jgi:predicted Zn-dependent peptidase